MSWYWVGPITVGVLAFVLRWWWWWRKSWLWVEDDGVIAWTPIDNTFAGGGRLSGSDVVRDYNKGFLMQLGSYEDKSDPPGVPDWVIKEVLLKKHRIFWGSAVKKRLAPSDFEWINVGEDWTAFGGAALDHSPLLLDHALQLYPGPAPEGPMGGDITGIRVKPPSDPERMIDYPHDAAASAVDKLYARCVRGRRLHALLNVQAILTYWQGARSWSYSASHGELSRHNQNDFTFSHSIRVEVHSYDPEAEPSWTTEVFAPGEIDRIEIRVERGPGAAGTTRQDPPWP